MNLSEIEIRELLGDSMDSLVSYNTFYVSWHEAMAELTDEQYGRISRALNEYCFFGIEPDLSGNEKIIFTMARYIIDSSTKSKINGKAGGRKGKGGAPKGNKNAVQGKTIPPYREEQYPPIDPDIEKNNSNGNGNGNGNGKGNGNENGKENGNGKDKSGASTPDDDFSEPPLSESQKSALELSGLLLSSHRKEIPDYLSGKKDIKTIQRWADDIEKLIRIDKKSPDKIRQVILWAKTPGNFWFNNIQSGEKLRKHFERLFGQMQTDSGKRFGTRPPAHRIAADNIPPDDLDQYFN
jgi:hypothetical protein